MYFSFNPGTCPMVCFHHAWSSVMSVKVPGAFVHEQHATALNTEGARAYPTWPMEVEGPWQKQTRQPSWCVMIATRLPGDSRQLRRALIRSQPDKRKPMFQGGMQCAVPGCDPTAGWGVAKTGHRLNLFENID
uniref:Uncharacterized protein n=1 Tax=Eutreptiella gymnastica TaxID=73025 RepID=A0A7S1J0S0_9EUGL